VRGRPPSISEEVVLDAARDVFCEFGHRATTADIARRAGVSEGILFYRYKSKEALLAVVIQREAEPPDELKEVIAQAGSESLPESLERLVKTVLEATIRVHPLLDLAMTSSASSAVHKELFAKRKKPGPERTMELIARYLEREIRLGRVRRIDTLSIARTIFGGCDAFVRAERFGGVRRDRSDFVRCLVDLLLNGIATPAREKSR
jgi:AcrR family transcriptional regulator